MKHFKVILSAGTFVFFMLLTGCSSTYRVSDFSSKEKFYESINKAAKGKVVNITLKNGSLINAFNVKMSNDSTAFSTKNYFQYNIPISNVKAISYKNTSEGIVTGALTGIAAGLLITISKVIPANSQEGNPPYPKDYDYPKAGMISIPIGIVSGSIIGWLIGHNYTYEFNP